MKLKVAIFLSMKQKKWILVSQNSGFEILVTLDAFLLKFMDVPNFPNQLSKISLFSYYVLFCVLHSNVYDLEMKAATLLLLPVSRFSCYGFKTKERMK